MWERNTIELNSRLGSWSRLALRVISFGPSSGGPLDTLIILLSVITLDDIPDKDG